MALLAGCAGQGPVDRSQGVILISLDTLRADRLGCYGYDRPTSPFLDELAARGTLFEHAIVQLPGTLPSHMSMLTGLLPAEHNVFPPEGVLADSVPLVQELLRASGLRTAGFTEGGYVAARFGFSRGFEEFDDSARKSNTDIEDVFSRGLDFLGRLEEGDRFFLFLHTYAIHDPYFPPAPYCDLYLPGTDRTAIEGVPVFPVDGLTQLPEVAQEVQRQRFRNSLAFIRANLPPGAPLPTGPNLVELNRASRHSPVSGEIVDFYSALYDATINYVDDVIRSFMAELATLGLADRVTVIITSDHGEEFFEHGRFTHEQVYHECLHVPLIVVGAGVQPGQRIPDLVASIDITPTILDILSVPAPAHQTGRSIRPALHSGTAPLPRRDAHAMGIVDPSEAIYRIQESELYQAIEHSETAQTGGEWVVDQMALESVAHKLQFEAMSFHRNRTVEVYSSGRKVAEFQVTPEWTRVDVDLPAEEGKHEVVLRSDTCDRPIDLGVNDDQRCLSFRVRGLSRTRLELFNVTRDPKSQEDLSGLEHGLLADLLSALTNFDREPRADRHTLSLDEDTRRRLEELGYLQ